MKDQLEQRLKGLRAEFEAGQQMLAEMEGKRTSLKESLLRISGAIQVLEEELAQVAESAESDSEQGSAVAATASASSRSDA